MSTKPNKATFTPITIQNSLPTAIKQGKLVLLSHTKLIEAGKLEGRIQSKSRLIAGCLKPAYSHTFHGFLSQGVLFCVVWRSWKVYTPLFTYHAHSNVCVHIVSITG